MMYIVRILYSDMFPSELCLKILKTFTIQVNMLPNLNVCRFFQMLFNLKGSPPHEFNVNRRTLKKYIVISINTLETSLFNTYRHVLQGGKFITHSPSNRTRKFIGYILKFVNSALNMILLSVLPHIRSTNQ